MMLPQCCSKSNVIGGYGKSLALVATTEALPYEMTERELIGSTVTSVTVGPWRWRDNAIPPDRPADQKEWQREIIAVRRRPRHHFSATVLALHT